MPLWVKMSIIRIEDGRGQNDHVVYEIVTRVLKRLRMMVGLVIKEKLC
jgi:hypothetical protein